MVWGCMQGAAGTALATVLLSLGSWLGLAVKAGSPAQPSISAAERTQAIRNALVWQPIDPTTLDVIQGPRFAAGTHYGLGETVRCTFVDPDTLAGPLGGMTQKFLCRTAQGEVIKVSYDLDNGEVFADVAASRLLWMLGFGAHSISSVRVVCDNCPEDPWGWYNLSPAQRQLYRASRQLSERPPWSAWTQRFIPGQRVFIPATVETRHPGWEIEQSKGQGWRFGELALVSQQNASLAAEQKQHRDALILLNAMLQNADTKAENQTLLCLDGEAKPEPAMPCRRSLLMIDDGGWSFGRGYVLSKPFEASKMRLDHWRATPVWRDRDRCVAAVHPFFDGTLRPSVISEAGRRFLLQRFALLSQEQKIDLFRAARTSLQQIKARSAEQWGEPAAWAEILNGKIAEIAAVTCPR